MEGKLHKPFASLGAASCGWMVKDLGMVCNGILGPKEYPMGVGILEPCDSLNAATIIPLRGGSKLQGTPGPFLLPSLQEQPPPFLLFPLSCDWVLEGPIS